MNERLLGYLMLALALVFYLVAAASIVATLHALTVTTTIAAIESAFGTLVIALIFLVLARKLWNVAKSRIKSEA